MSAVGHEEESRRP